MSRTLHDAERLLNATASTNEEEPRASNVSAHVRRMSSALRGLALDEAERAENDSVDLKQVFQGGRRDSWMNELHDLGAHISELADMIGPAPSSGGTPPPADIHGYVSLIMDSNYT